MKPKPLVGLNHFTVPIVIENSKKIGDCHVKDGRCPIRAQLGRGANNLSVVDDSEAIARDRAGN